MFDWGGLVKGVSGLLTSFIQASAAKKAEKRSLQGAIQLAEFRADIAKSELEFAARLAESEMRWAAVTEMAQKKAAEKARTEAALVAIAQAQSQERQSHLFIGAAVLGLAVLAGKK